MPTPRHLLLLQYACLAGVDALLMNEDWLVGRPLETSSLHGSKDVLTLSNGLVSRTFKLSPNFATIDLRSDVTNAGLLRFVQPEALISFSCAPSPDVPVSTMSYRNVSIGGLVGQQLHTQLNFANDGAVNWTSPIGAMQYVSHEVGPIKAPFAWTPGQRHSRDDSHWPPKGITFTVHFAPPQGKYVDKNATCAERCWCGVSVAVVYEIFDGIPVISKSIVITNSEDRVVYADEVVIEALAIVEHGMSKLTIETDFPNPRKTFWTESYTSLFRSPPNGSYAAWRQNYPSQHIDPSYQDLSHDSSVFGDFSFLKLLVQVGYPSRGPAQPICSATASNARRPPGSLERFQTFRVLLLVHDGCAAGGGAFDDAEERRSLARRKMFRILAPQTTENPLYFYSSSSSNDSIQLIAEQWSSIGGEGMLLGAGSGFNPSDLSESNVAQTKAKFDVAHAHGLIIGGYVFLQGPPGGTPLLQQCHNPDAPEEGINQADMSTAWYKDFLDRIITFISLTGQDMLETDGPFEGASCYATNVSDFVSPRNSQSRQVQAIIGFYQTLKERYNTYLTVPDPYELTSGVNKEPIGYTDTYCHIDSSGSGSVADVWKYLNIGRAYYYDGLYHYPPTGGWMTFDMEHVDNQPPGVPITPPRLNMLEWALAQYLGSGNVADMHGSRVWDPLAEAHYPPLPAPSPKRLWQHYMKFYIEHRRVLTADVVHVHRPQLNGQYDFTLHVERNASTTARSDGRYERAMGSIFNGGSIAVPSQTLLLPLWYAGVAPGSGVVVEWLGKFGVTEPPFPPQHCIVRSDGTVKLTGFHLEAFSFVFVLVTAETPRG